MLVIFIVIKFQKSTINSNDLHKKNLAPKGQIILISNFSYNKILNQKVKKKLLRFKIKILNLYFPNFVSLLCSLIFYFFFQGQCVNMFWKLFEKKKINKQNHWDHLVHLKEKIWRRNIIIEWEENLLLKMKQKQQPPTNRFEYV